MPITLALALFLRTAADSLSPNGRYLAHAVPLPDKNAEAPGLEFVDRHTGKVISTDEDLRKAVNLGSIHPEFVVDEWIAGTTQAVVRFNASYEAHESISRRYGYDFVQHKLTPFNGWRAPDGRFALFPQTPYMAETYTYHYHGDYLKAPFLLVGSDGQFDSKHGKRVMLGRYLLQADVQAKPTFAKSGRAVAIDAFVKEVPTRVIIDLRTGRAKKAK